MSQNEKKFGKNQTKFISAEDHAEKRAAARRRKQANRGTATQQGGLAAKQHQEINEARRRAGFAPLPTPAEKAEQERREADREVKRFNFRAKQAEMATQHDDFKKLQSSSFQWKVAVEIFAEFVKADKQENKSRTTTAVLVAEENLTGGRGYAPGTEHDLAKRGEIIARKALQWAYDELNLVSV